MIRVFIVDDHPLVIEGIHSLLANESNIHWAGHALSAAACNAYFDKNDADVILMDINLPDKSGIDLCTEIKKKKPGTQVLALSTLNQPSYIRKMVESGASGYILKNADKEEMISAIEDVANGKTHMCAEALEVIRHTYNAETGKPILTRREKEILALIAEGMTNAEMSEKLFVSQWTVDSHRKSIMTKLNTKNTAMLIKYAIENGLV